MADYTSESTGFGSRTTLSSWPYVILAGIVTYYTISIVQSYWRLRHIPGPKLAAISNLWWIRAAVSGTGHLALADVCDKHGKLWDDWKSLECCDRRET